MVPRVAPIIVTTSVPFIDTEPVTPSEPVIKADPVKGKPAPVPPPPPPPKAEEAVVYNCPVAVSIITTFDWAADVNPFKNTDPDVVNDPDTMG